MSAGDHAPPVKGRAAVAGMLCALLAIAVAELLAGLVPGVPSLVTVVGEVVIDNVPPTVEDLAIEIFGTADKLALQVGTVVLAGLAGLLVGRLALRSFSAAILGFALFAAIGTLATLASPQSGLFGGAFGAIVGAGVGLAALRVLLRAAVAARDAMPAAESDHDRRAFLKAAVTVGGAAAASGYVGRALLGPSGPTDSAVAAQLPAPRPSPTAPPPATVNVDGIPPLYTPNENFYRIDTALRIPRADLENWTLSFTGLVDNPFSLTYDQLLDEADTEADITLACVSNEVGGGLVDNARWFGVPLYRMLERAGVQPEGEQIVGVSLDNFTVGFPTQIAMDRQEALIAVGMNGEALPLVHGFPARLVVPGLYGYVSATKWLSEIRLDTAGFDAYWVPRGWSKEGPIKTQSRIDVPSGTGQVSAGTVPVAGVAWAPSRGIERVEVRIDDGQWQEAELAASLDVDSWRQWVYRWQAEPGSHEISVRATDGAGETQTSERMPPRPSGATGYHTISVDVA